MMRVQRLLSRRILCHRSPWILPVDSTSWQYGAVAYASTGQLRRRDRETGLGPRALRKAVPKPYIRPVAAGGRDPRNDDFPASLSHRPRLTRELSNDKRVEEPRNDEFPTSRSHKPWLTRQFSSDPRAEDGPSRELQREHSTVWRPFTESSSSGSHRDHPRTERPFITDDPLAKEITKFKFSNFKLKGAPRSSAGRLGNRKPKPKFFKAPEVPSEISQQAGSPYGAIWDAKPNNKKDRKKWAAQFIARAKARKEAASSNPHTTNMAVLSRESRWNVNRQLKPEQSQRAKAYFDRSDAIRLWRTKRYKDVPPTSYPEVVFVGAANSGVSSLINFTCVSTKMVARVSHKPGHTMTLVGHAVGGRLPPPVKGHSKLNIGRWERYLSGEHQIMLVDVPGYGVPESAEIGDEIMKFLTLRQQVRKIYVCVDAYDGIRDDDIRLLFHLRKEKRPYQIVLTKVDQLLPSTGKNKNNELWIETLTDVDQAILQEARLKALHKINSVAHKQGLAANVAEDILCCCGVHSQETQQRGKQRTVGLGDVRWSIMKACGIPTEPAETTERGGLPKGESQKED